MAPDSSGTDRRYFPLCQFQFVGLNTVTKAFIVVTYVERRLLRVALSFSGKLG